MKPKAIKVPLYFSSEGDFVFIPLQAVISVMCTSQELYDIFSSQELNVTKSPLFVFDFMLYVCF